MLDRFARLAPSLTSPATHGFAIIPSDTGTLDEVTRAIYVGAAGDLAVTMADGTELVFSAVAAGTWLPIRVSAVSSTGTTAGSLIGLL